MRSLRGLNTTQPVDKAAVIEFAHEAAVDDILQFNFAAARVAASESSSAYLMRTENFLKQFDVAIEVVVDLGCGERRGDSLDQVRRIGRRVDAVGNAL